MGLVLGGDLQENGIFTWRVSDCEELVGSNTNMLQSILHNHQCTRNDTILVLLRLHKVYLY